MTAIDLGALKSAGSITRPKLPRGLRKLLVLLWRRRRSVRTYLELSRLDEKLLYDIGIEPLDVREALHNQASPSILLEPMRRQFNFDRDDTHGAR